MLTRRSTMLASLGAMAGGSAALAQQPDTLFLPPVLSTQPQFEPRLSASGTSIQSADVTISVADSPLPNALDVYYSFITGLAARNGYTSGKDKMLLFNTITSFDISKDTPYYNEGLFRAFADRVFKDSPENTGTANRADRFSLQYENMIRTAAAKLDRKYPDVIRQVQALQSDLETQTTKLGSRVQAINKEWSAISASLSLKPSDESYELKYINYLEQIRYADQIDQYTKNIDLIIGSIDAVRRLSYTPSEQLILDNLVELSLTKKIARPRRPNFERTVKNVTELTFADPTIRVESITDVSPSAYPLGDLVKFLNVQGTRSLSISKTSSSTEQHDRQWSAGGSGRFSFFGIFGAGGGGGGSGSSNTVQQVSKSNGIDISFENIDEILVDRDLWFNPALLQDKDLVKLLSKIPGYDRLQYVSVSLIIARGLTLTLKFDSAVDNTSWSKQQFNANGGVSLFGFSFGASGSSSRYDYSLDVAGDKKSVTFKDDPQLTRLLAVRLEQFVTPQTAKTGVATTGDSPLMKFRNGQIDYLGLQSSKF